MAKISGILTDGAGQVINDCTIELYAKKTTIKVLTQTQAFKVAENGSYTMNVLPCEYEVSLIINGFPKKRLGTIQVFSDSNDGTLNDFLLNPSESEITPAILQHVFEARNETNKSANKVVESEKKIKISENNALESSKLAKTSADNAKSSEEEASKTATAVKNSVDDAKKYADLSAVGANNAKTSADNAKNSADLANQSATKAKNSAQQSADNAIATKSSADAAKNSELSAKKSADDAKNAASSIDTSVFIKKSSIDNQSINGSLDVKNLTENGQRVYSPNNKPTADDIGTIPAVKKQVNGASIYVVSSHLVFKDAIGDQRLMPFRHDELPFGWYFQNGDNYLLSSAQGQALNSLSANYKIDHRITIKTINGLQYINVPTAFAPDGRGYFMRAVNGTTRQVGSIEGDAIRNIKGALQDGPGQAFIGHENVTNGRTDGAISIHHSGDEWLQNGSRHLRWAFFNFDASRVVPTANENRPINIGLTPTIYLGV